MENVILEVPWFHHIAATLEFPSHTISFTFRDRQISIAIEDCGYTIPIVSHLNLQKSIQNLIYAYLIFINESGSLQIIIANDDLSERFKTFG